MSAKLTEPIVRWGILTLVCFDLLGFFSIQFVRMKYYNLFFRTHAVGLIVALPAVCGSYPPPLAQLTATLL
jgi:ferric-chelate reductase